jgi:hypothetical protein
MSARAVRRADRDDGPPFREDLAERGEVRRGPLCAIRAGRWVAVMMSVSGLFMTAPQQTQGPATFPPGQDAAPPVELAEQGTKAVAAHSPRALGANLDGSLDAGRHVFGIFGLDHVVSSSCYVLHPCVSRRYEVRARPVSRKTRRVAQRVT